MWWELAGGEASESAGSVFAVCRFWEKACMQRELTRHRAPGKSQTQNLLCISFDKDALSTKGCTIA